MTIVLDGLVYERCPFGTVQASAGTILVKPAGTLHSSGVGPAGARTLGLEASGEVAAGGSAALGPRPHAVPIPHGPEISFLLEELHARTRPESLVVEGLTAAIWGRVTRAVRENADVGGDSGKLAAVRRIVEAEFRSSLTLSALAERVGMSPDHLSRTFRQRYGSSPSSMIRRKRVEWAAAQLTTSDVSLSNVAGEAGFADQSHMTRQFRRRYGTTPGRYRAGSGR